MKTLVLSTLFAAGAMVAGLSAAPAASAATSVLVAQCVEFTACYNGGPTPWSDALTGAQLTALGLGTNTPFIVAETSQFVIRVGVTTINFVTSSGSVTETLGEFNGVGFYNDPCPGFCEVDTIGTFFIPADALSAVISGTFGNSVVGSSAGENLYLGALPASVPEPSTWAMMILGVAGVGFGLRRSAGKRAIAAA